MIEVSPIGSGRSVQSMSNFASQLKAEISRIAKRESRQETASLKKSASQARSDIAALKRRIGELEALVRRLAKTAPASAAASSADSQKTLRFRAGGFAALRTRLDLSAAQMAQLLGVSAQSVYHWESGKSRPRASQLGQIANLRKLGKKQVQARLAE